MTLLQDQAANRLEKQIWEKMAANKTEERKRLWRAWMDEDKLYFLPRGLWTKPISSFLEKKKKNMNDKRRTTPPAGQSWYKKRLTADFKEI